MYIERNIFLSPTNDVIAPLCISVGKLNPFLGIFPDHEKLLLQHIYITSDEAIEKGNWVITRGGIRYVTSINNKETFTDDGKVSGLEPSALCHLVDYKLIIATTNKSLKIHTKEQWNLVSGLSTTFHKVNQLPEPSLEWLNWANYFIEQYNLGNIITKVMVEYCEQFICQKCGNVQYNDSDCNNCESNRVHLKYKLKVNSDNTINIRYIKNSWSREDMTNIAKLSYNKALKSVGYSQIKFGEWFDKWIEQNLNI